MSKVATKTGTIVRSCGVLYKAVVQTVLLYGSDIWVLAGSMLKLLEVFPHRTARRIVGMVDWHTTGGD